MSTAKSIPVEKLADIAQSAAQKVIGNRIAELGGDAKIGLFPDIGIFGIVIRDYDFDQIKVADMLEMSAGLTDRMRDIAEGATPTVQFNKTYATMGFFPPFPIEMRDLR